MNFWISMIAFAAASVLVYAALAINGKTSHGGGSDSHGHKDHGHGSGHH